MSNMLSLIEETIPWKEKLLRLTSTFELFTSAIDDQQKRRLELKDLLEEEVGEAARALKKAFPDGAISMDFYLS